jgi:type IV secretion system protein VirB9
VRLALALALALVAVPAAGLAAQALDGDGRVTTITYSAATVIPLRTAASNTLTIMLAPGERVLNVEVGDPEAIDVALAGSSDGLFVRTLRAPANPSLTVKTDLRAYNFAVQVGPPAEASYAVRFAYAPQTAAPPPPPAPAANEGRYKLSGTRVLRPERISDDGVHTYLEWPEDAALPAVFALNSIGEEEMVDGYMRAGIFTIDRVNPVLVFRIGKKSAKAERLRGR